MAKLISKTYGDALFELAVEKKCEDSLLSETEEVLEALSQNPDFSKLMTHPKILKEEKLKILEAVFKGRVSYELTGFMTIIIKKESELHMSQRLLYWMR